MSRESKRKEIRKTVESVLKRAKIPQVDQDIFSQRSIPTEHETLPIILLYPKTENIDRNDHSPKSYQRVLAMEIEVQTTADNDSILADELDDLAQYVEDAMESSKELIELLNELDLKSVVYDTESDGSSPIGSVRLSYDLEYFTDESRDSDDLVPFKCMNTEYDLDTEDNEIDAEDLIKLPQE